MERFYTSLRMTKLIDYAITSIETDVLINKTFEESLLCINNIK